MADLTIITGPISCQKVSRIKEFELSSKNFPGGWLADPPKGGPHQLCRAASGSAVPVASAADYFRITITTPVLDCLLQELHVHFSDGQSSAVSGLLAAHAVMKKTTDWKASLKHFLPAHSSIVSELDNWRVKWSQVDEVSLPSCSIVQTTLQQGWKHTLHNTLAAVAILAVRPITSCECERSVSALCLLKTYSSTMGQGGLPGLALHHIHYNVAVNAAVDMITLQHPWKMRMTSFLHDAE